MQGSINSREDQEFVKFAENFLNQMKNDFYNDKFAGSKKLSDYIRELDKRERKQIENKYRKIFTDTKRLKKKLKRKR